MWLGGVESIRLQVLLASNPVVRAHAWVAMKVEDCSLLLMVSTEARLEARQLLECPLAHSPRS